MGTIPSDMTIFYFKSSGDIAGYCTGKQDFSYFGDYAADYCQIYDVVVLPYDDYVIDNKTKFRIDKVTLEPIVKAKADEQLLKYKKEKTV
jgi:hypothetical protein